MFLVIYVNFLKEQILILLRSYKIVLRTNFLNITMAQRKFQELARATTTEASSNISHDLEV